MKQLTFKLILPLTVISFATITKWWYALPVDAPDTLFAGFPFPFVCDGWHTSMSLQLFVTEFFADFLTYFLFWFIVIFCIDRFWTKINSSKTVTIVLWVLTGLLVSGATLIASNSDNIFYVKRPFDIDIMETGYKFVWQQTERPDYYKYHPEEKKELNVDHIKNIRYVFEDYTKYQESTDSQDDKDLITKSLKSLTTVTDKDDLDLLINVWMYYDPTDYPDIPEIYRILKSNRPHSIEAVKNRIDNKKEWETDDTAPYSDLKKLLQRLENE